MTHAPTRTSLAAILLACALLGSAGCAARPPSEPPGITGTITSLEPAGDSAGDVRATMLVEGGQQPPGAVSDKASVRIVADTDVFDTSGAEVGWESLSRGQGVEVWFEGPVAESYPVQGTAGAVRLTP